MGEGEEQGVVKIADFGLARIYQAPLKPLFENGVLILCFPFILIVHLFFFSFCFFLVQTIIYRSSKLKGNGLILHPKFKRLDAKYNVKLLYMTRKSLHS